MKLLTGITVILFASAVSAQQHVAFSARLNTPIDNAASGVVNFTEVTANSGNWYDVATAGFTVPTGEDGVYYLGLSLGVPAYGECSTGIYQSGSSRVFTGIQFANTNVDGIEYASRGFMRELTPAMTKAFEVQNDAGCSMLGDPYGTSTWTMFRYRDLSDLSVSFSVARNNDFSEYDLSIEWQVEFVNDGITNMSVPINATTGYFEAPLDAFYFFHMSAMSRPNLPMHAELVVWPAMLPMVDIVCFLNRESGDADGEDTTSRSLILRLYEGDQVSMGNVNNSVLGSSPSGYELSFSGFAYANDTNDPKSVAFCAYMIDWEWIPEDTLPLVNWTTANVNFAGGSPDPFNLATGEFVVPSDGTYFVSFSVGIKSNMYCLVGLTDQFNNEVARIDRRNTVHDGTDTLSRDIVLDVRAGDTLRLQAYNGTGLISTHAGKETSFMAMRVRETQ